MVLRSPWNHLQLVVEEPSVVLEGPPVVLESLDPLQLVVEGPPVVLESPWTPYSWL